MCVGCCRRDVPQRRRAEPVTVALDAGDAPAAEVLVRSLLEARSLLPRTHDVEVEVGEHGARVTRDAAALLMEDDETALLFSGECLFIAGDESIIAGVDADDGSDELRKGFRERNGIDRRSGFARVDARGVLRERLAKQCLILDDRP